MFNDKDDDNLSMFDDESNVESELIQKPLEIKMGIHIDWVLSMNSENFNKYIKGNNGETEEQLRKHFLKLKNAGKTSIFDEL